MVNDAEDGGDGGGDNEDFYSSSFYDTFARDGATKKLVNEANEAKRYVGMCHYDIFFIVKTKRWVSAIF